MLATVISAIFFCLVGFASGMNLSGRPAAFSEHLTAKTVVVRMDSKTTETRTLLSTAGNPFLENVLQRLPEPNKSIVQLMLLYPVNGVHDYWWPRKGEYQYDGTTTDVMLNKEVVLKGEPRGRTFCCGLTLEIFYNYIGTRPALAAKISDDPAKFKRDWFCRELFSPGPQEAMEGAGLGKQIIESSDVLPGDFVQIWRNDKSGHSVIFVNWLWDKADKIVGLQYWSTQTATNGIGYSSEIFGALPKQINLKHISVSRPNFIN